MRLNIQDQLLQPVLIITKIKFENGIWTNDMLIFVAGVDNPKALVIGHKKGEEVDFNHSALKLFTYLGTESKASLPLRPRTKGYA